MMHATLPVFRAWRASAGLLTLAFMFVAVIAVVVGGASLARAPALRHRDHARHLSADHWRHRIHGGIPRPAHRRNSPRVDPLGARLPGSFAASTALRARSRARTPRRSHPPRRLEPVLRGIARARSRGHRGGAAQCRWTHRGDAARTGARASSIGARRARRRRSRGGAQEVGGALVRLRAGLSGANRGARRSHSHGRRGVIVGPGEVSGAARETLAICRPDGELAQSRGFSTRRGRRSESRRSPAPPTHRPSALRLCARCPTRSAR